jgi:hypothetical protein
MRSLTMDTAKYLTLKVSIVPLNPSLSSSNRDILGLKTVTLNLSGAIRLKCCLPVAFVVNSRGNPNAKCFNRGESGLGTGINCRPKSNGARMFSNGSGEKG